jgi:uncharacterized membrane protein YoaK (UPF0700 family)
MRKPETSARQTPPALTVVLVALTAFSGLIDAASYLGLDHVFVANMTGNVIFIGFGLGGVRTLDLAASIVALGAFLIGAAGGGRLALGLAARRRLWLVVSTGTQTLCVATAAVALATGVAHVHDMSRLVVVALLAIGMGLQNALARRLNVPDLTTTVVTRTLTSLAAESRVGGDRSPGAGRRVMAVTTMLAGALAGAVLVLHAGLIPTLFAGAALLAMVTVISGVWPESGE